MMLNGCGTQVVKAKLNDRTEKSNLTHCILFARVDTVSSRQPRRLGVVEEKSSVVVWSVVNAAAIWENGPEVVWSSLLAGPCPTHASVVFPKYVWFVLLGWSMWKVDHGKSGGGLLSTIAPSIHSIHSGRSPLCCYSIESFRPFFPSSLWFYFPVSAVVDQKFPFGGICHPRFLMSRRVRVVVDPVQVDSICLPGCMFWNYSRFLRKRPEDWHVGVRFGHVGAVVVVGSIVSPWRYYGRSVECVNRFDIHSEKATATKNHQQQQNETDQKPGFFGVLSLAPATQKNENSVSASRIRILLGRFSFFNCLKSRIHDQDWTA